MLSAIALVCDGIALASASFAAGLSAGVIYMMRPYTQKELRPEPKFRPKA